MPFASALSTATAADIALHEVCSAVEVLGGAPDLAVVFCSANHVDSAAGIARFIAQRLRPRTLIGCVGEAIAGTGREVEHAPAISLWAARWSLPVEVTAFHLAPQQTPDGLSLLGWPDALMECESSGATAIVLGDPFTFPATEIFLPQINGQCRGVQVLGGMASGMSGPGEAPLLLNDDACDVGAVGVLLRGAPVRGVVSQGCRPVGKPFVVTKAQDQHVLELGGRPCLDQLRETYDSLPARDQELFQRGPHIGIVVNEYLPSFARGDFLVRNVYAVDRASGAMTITDKVRVGQTVQLHVRDAESADEDLRLLLRSSVDGSRRAGGALLFSCNGRGTRLFGAPHHDAGAIAEEIGSIPLAGFFAAGELGPVGGANFLHGFTASVALFED